MEKLLSPYININPVTISNQKIDIHTICHPICPILMFADVAVSRWNNKNHNEGQSEIIKDYFGGPELQW